MSELPRLFPYDPVDGDLLPYPSIGATPAAGAVFDFLSNFTIPEGRAAGQAIEGDAVPPYIRRAIEIIFGHRDEDGRRIITNSMFCAPRKSAKTWLSALLGIAFLYSERESGGEILIVASSQKQARRCFELITRTLRTNQRLWGQLRVQDVGSTLTHLKTGTTLKATASDPKTLWGLSPSCLILDESHAWEGVRGNRLFDSLVTGMGARQDRLTLITSTVPDHPPDPTEVFSQQLNYALKVQSGQIDDRRYLPLIWLTPPDADPHSEVTWHRANPGLGSVLDINELRDDYKRELATDPSLAAFRAMRLNMLPTSALDERWLSPAMVASAVRPDPVTLETLAECERVVVALDYGGGWDLATAVILGDQGDGQVIALQRSWVCSAGLERIVAAVPEVREMVRRDELTVSGAEAVTAKVVIDDVVDICRHLGLEEVGMDPAMSQLVTAGFASAGISLVECRQGAISMSPAMSWLEEALSEKKLDIGDDRLFEWAMGNVSQVSSSIGRRPVKSSDDSSSNPRKIDPVSALLSAAQLLLENRNAEASGQGDGIEWIDPYLDPVNAQAITEGGVAFDLMVTLKPSSTGGWVFHG
jgi:phage terminase large subunit-like protein